MKPKEFATLFRFKSTLPDYPEEWTHSISLECSTHTMQAPEHPAVPWFRLDADGGVGPNGTVYT
eukprot:937137-Rhodomonas_salina.1